MKTFRKILFVSILLLPVVSAAQLRVSLRLEHDSFLQFEPLLAFVSIYNDSDTPFVLDEDAKDNNAHVRFGIEKKRDEPVLRINKQPMVRKLQVMTDEEQEIFADLSLWYDVGSVGRYVVRAEVDWNGKTFRSNEIMIDIVRGIEIRSVSRNVPGHPELMCKYSLRYWARGNSEYLFLRVDEEDSGTNYGVFQLGRVIRVFKPVIEVDRSGNVKVIHQSGRDCYTRSMFKSSRTSVRFVDQTYHLPNGDPYPVAGTKQ